MKKGQDYDSRWHYFPGQSSATTKISDRMHELHITSEAWHKITGHLDRKRQLQVKRMEEEGRKNNMRQTSRAMTQNWANSMENTRIRHEKERLEGIDRRRTEKVQEFYDSMELQAKKRQEYVEKVERDQFLAQQDYCRDLRSAYLHAITVQEREHHKKIRERIKNDAIQMDEQITSANFDEKLDSDGKRDRTVKYRMELQEQIRDRAKVAEQERELCLKQELEEQNQIQNCLDAIEVCENNKKRELYENLNRERDEAIQMAEYCRNRDKRDDHELDQRNAIYNQANERIKCLRKQKERECQQFRLQRAEGSAKRLTKLTEDRAEHEEKLYQDQMEKLNLKEIDEETERRKSKMAERRSRQNEQMEGLKRLQEEKQKVQQELKKWQLLNAQKEQEIVQQDLARKAKEKRETTLEYRNALLHQIKENEDLRRREESEENEAYFGQMTGDEQDRRFFEFAEEMQEKAKNRGAPTYSIEKVVQRYKKSHGLDLNMGRSSCQHLPR